MDRGKIPQGSPDAKRVVVLCYWAVRQLGITATELAGRIGISQPAVSISVKRGEEIVNRDALCIDALLVNL